VRDTALRAEPGVRDLAQLRVEDGKDLVQSTRCTAGGELQEIGQRCVGVVHDRFRQAPRVQRPTEVWRDFDAPSAPLAPRPRSPWAPASTQSVVASMARPEEPHRFGVYQMGEV